MKIGVKIKILLEGELTFLKKKLVESWFSDAFKWVDTNERYKFGAKLKKAKDRWEKQLENKEKNDYRFTKI